MNTLLYVCLGVLALGIAASADSSSCPEYKQCLKDLEETAKHPKLPVLCKALNESSNCFQAVQKNCPDTENIKLSNESLIKIWNTEWKDGCEGKCAEEGGKCMAAFAKNVNPKPGMSFNSKTCKILTEGLNCVEKLKTAKTCSPSIANALKYSAMVFKQKYFSDVCDDNGNPSQCLKDFLMCTDDISDLPKKPTPIQACNAMETYLECSSDIKTCHSNIKDEKDLIAKKMETTETASRCPVVGSCDERMMRCANTTENAMNNFNAANITDLSAITEELCTDLRTSVHCFKFVQKDKTCILKAGAIKDKDDKVEDIYKKYCDCNVRIDTCEDETKSLLKNTKHAKMSKADTKKFCNAITENKKCFATARSDMACKGKTSTKLATEDDLEKANKSFCGDGASTLIVSTAAMLIGVFVSMMNKF